MPSPAETRIAPAKPYTPTYQTIPTETCELRAWCPPGHFRLPRHFCTAVTGWRLLDNLLNDTSRLAIGDGKFLAVALVSQLSVVQAKEMKDRGEIVVVVYDILLGAVAELIGGAERGAALD